MSQPIGKRIIVIGSSGSGKSTLAELLSERLGVPFIELDGLYWEPGWVEAERETFRERIRQAIEPPAWVMAGNYTRHQQDVSWPAADTIIWLDLPLTTVLRRVARRTWDRSRKQEALYGTENREIFREHLMLWNPEKSLIAYTAKTHRARRRAFEVACADPRWSHVNFIRLRSVKASYRWLEAIPMLTGGGAPTPVEPPRLHAVGVREDE